MSARLVALLALLITGWTTPATAADIPADKPDKPGVRLHLHVEASAVCPDQAAFVAELRARGVVVRDVPEGGSAATLHVELSTESGGAIGRLTFRPPEGPLEGEALHREVSGADCTSVAEGLALIAAVILNPPAPTVDSQPSPAANPTPAPAPAPHPAPASDADDAPVFDAPSSTPGAVPPAEFHLGGGAALIVAGGVGPNVALIAGGVVEVGLPAPLGRWSARLTVGRAFSRTIDSLGTAQFDLTDFRLEPCFRVVGSATLRLRACALLEGGILEGEGRGEGGETKDRALLEVGLGVRPSWTLRNGVVLGLSAGAAVAALPRYEFYFSSKNQVAYRVDLLSESGEFSIGVPFW